MSHSKEDLNSFEQEIAKTISFIEKEQMPYFVLGGLAVAVWGEPRFTYDLDLDLFLSKREISSFLEKAEKVGFKFDPGEVHVKAETFGTFRVFLKNLQIDFILASTELEKSALARRVQCTMFKIPIWFPSAEDLLLLKVIPGRPKDLMDAESIALRQKGKLDQSYLKEWGQKICDEAEDYRVLHLIDKFLKY